MKSLPLILCAAILNSACSKTIKETKVEFRDRVAGETNAVKNSINDIEQIKKVLTEHAPNIALAELLAKTVSSESRKEMTALISKLNDEEARSLVRDVVVDYNNIRNQFLFPGKRYQNNKVFFQNSLLAPDEQSDAQFASDNMLKISVFTYIKNKALNDVIETYEKNATSLGKEIATQIAGELAASSPASAKKIDEAYKTMSKEDFIKTLESMKPYMEKIDTYFKNSKLNHNEQYTVLMGGAVAGSLYLAIKDNGDFQRLLARGQKLVHDFQVIKKKAMEMVTLVNALDTHIRDTEKNINTLATSMSEIGNDLQYVELEATKELRKGSTVHSRRIVNFLHENIISGKKSGDGENSSIFTRPVHIDKNISKSLTAAANISNNLSSIINTTNNMANLLGIKLSKDTQKIMDTANKVAAVANAAGIAIQGFAAGGPMGAVVALGATNLGALGAAFGGGGDNSVVQFAAINHKLNEIIENQKNMLKMQVETMKMMKDLAIMVDEYHQKEMMALAGLRDLSLVQIEMSKIELNRNIKTCERMINFQLSSVWRDSEFNFNSNFGINNVHLINAKFLSNIRSLKDIRRITTAGGMDSFANCQEGIAEAFSEINTENPILAIFNTDEQNQLYKWQRDTYLPLLNALTHFSGTANFDSIPLHILSSNYTGLELKATMIDKVEKTGSVYSSNYELEHLLSVKSLERYLTRLLILYPLLEVDKDIWKGSISEIVDNYLENASYGGNQNIRSFFYLKNALKMVQSALAQESILSGEPLLDILHKKYKKVIFSTQSCQDLNLDQSLMSGEELSIVCSLRKNKLLMKNLLNYSIYSQHNEMQYKLAYETNDLLALSKLMNNHIEENRLKVVGGRIKLEISINNKSDKKDDVKYLLDLPTPTELAQRRIIYSENVSRLMKMQNLVIEALEKVYPNRGAKEQFLKLFFMVENK